MEEGVLTKEECSACDFGDDVGQMDYRKIYSARFDLLHKAYERSEIYKNREFIYFRRVTVTVRGIALRGALSAING